VGVMASDRQKALHRRGVRLEVFTVAWNVIEAGHGYAQAADGRHSPHLVGIHRNAIESHAVVATFP
jgi:hypothetical protein